MIFRSLVDFLFTILNYALGLLPSAGSGDIENLSTIQEMITTLMTSIAWANFFFPIDEAVRLFTFWIIMYIVVGSVRFIVRLVRG